MTDLGQPTPERRRRSAFAEGPATATEDGPAQAGARVYRSVSVLQRLVRNDSIEPRHLEAGEQFRADYELGVEGAREAAPGSASTTGWYYPDARLDALRRYENACNALGPTQNIIVAVAVYDHPISDIAKMARQNRQEVAGILKLGLTALADHYGIDCDSQKISHNIMLTSRDKQQKHAGNRPLPFPRPA